MVSKLAQKIREKRGAWISRLLDSHPQLTSKFTTQVQKQWILASYPSVVKACFKKLCPTIQQRQILPQHIYNMDEKGFLVGIASRVKVICVRDRKSPP